MILRGMKLPLFPTKEQEEKLFHICHGARKAYNYALERKIEEYEDYDALICDTTYLTQKDIRHSLDEDWRDGKLDWVSGVPEAVTKRSIDDLFKAYTNFFKKRARRPKFKSYRTAKLSFYQRVDNLRLFDRNTDSKVTLTGVGRVAIQLQKDKFFPNRPINPRVSYDGKHWYLSVAYEVEIIPEALSDKVIGVDVGILNLATTSEGKQYENINKTRRVINLTKRIKRLNRRAARQREASRKGEKKSNSLKKTENKLKLTYRRIGNINNTYLHEVSKDILSSKPSIVGIEDLNISGMMKNKHLARSIQEQRWYKLFTYLNYKAENQGTQLIKVSRTYPSSKTCSSCGHTKQNLNLSDRRFICPICGLIEDRDINAAINIAHYIEQSIPSPLAEIQAITSENWSTAERSS